jgi:hypothetical protein
MGAEMAKQKDLVWPLSSVFSPQAVTGLLCSGGHNLGTDPWYIRPRVSASIQQKMTFGNSADLK